MSTSTSGNGGILFNLAGAAVVLTVIGYMGYEFFHTPETPLCSGRYPAGKQFALDSQSGRPLSPIELQGRAGAREWGLLQNAEVIQSADAPGGASLNIKLASTGDEENVTRNGIGFAWPSSRLSKASAVCLSYGVFLPEKFSFAESGYLPGLYAAGDVWDLDQIKPADGFAARVSWGQGGSMGIELRSASGEEAWEGSKTGATWPLGRWVRVEQEILLNTAGQHDGVLRLWVDGALQVENTAMMFKPDRKGGLSGVVADIGYARAIGESATLKVSPFVLQSQ